MERLKRDHLVRVVGLGIALLIASLAVAPYFGRHFEYYPGDLYDGRLCMFLLEHAYQWISAPTASSLWDASFFYPVRGVIAYSESFIGSVPFYAPWRLVGFDRETSFQLWVITGFLLNFLAAWWVFTRLRFHWMASLFGAYVFAFSHVALAHLGHSQLHYRFAAPLAWYFIHRFLIQFSWKDLLGGLFSTFWQFCCCIYVGYFLSIFLALFILLTVVRRGTVRHYIRHVTPKSVLAHVVVVVGFFTALMGLAYPYIKTNSDPSLVNNRWQETIAMLPRPISYLIAKPGNLVTGWLYERAGVPMVHEHVMFVGIIPWLCVFVLFLARKRGLHPVVFPTVGALLAIVVLTLYVNHFSLYFILMRLPGVVGIRGVTRWILILLLPLSLAVAQIVHLVVEWFGARRRLFALALVGVAAGAILTESSITPLRELKTDAQARVSTLNSRLPAQIPNDAVLVNFSPAKGDELVLISLDAMLLAQNRKVFTVNGYTAQEPRGYRPIQNCSDLKSYLEDTAQYNTSFPLRDPASQIVALGDAPDWPCTHLNSPRTSQNEPLPADAFRAKIVVSSDSQVTVSSKLVAHVTVTNESSVLWRAKSRPDGKYAMRIGCRWIEPVSKAGVTDYNNRFEFPYDLQPSETAQILATMDTPRFVGSYLLQCDAVQELVHWFADMGSPVGTTELLIKDDKPALEGSLDVLDNERIAGWAWDKYSKEPVEVEIYDESRRLGAATANIFREDLLNAHKGNGAHGFIFPNRIDGNGRHKISARILGTTFELDGSPKAFERSGPPARNEAPASYEGTLDLADGQRIGGWAWNSLQPDRPAYIELYDGATLLATVLADAFRQDLLDAHKGNGKHGFNYAYRIDPKDSGIHRIRAKIAGTSFELGDSPKILNAGRSH